MGPHVVRQLVARGADVTVYHRGQHEPELPRAVCHLHGPAAAIPVLSFPEEASAPAPDVVIHMIAMGERDARAAVETFRGRTHRLVAISSGDVYQAYGRLTGAESGPPAAGLLTENSPLRTVWYPYRHAARSPDDWEHDYEKILMERVVLGEPSLQPVVLRLPKIYGPEENGDLATVHGFRHQPRWRWTHGYVENVAHAIVLAATHPAASGIYNIGEAYTPTVEERLAHLPSSSVPTATAPLNFEHDIAYDTSRIRQELGYVEPIEYRDAIRRTLGA